MPFRSKAQVVSRWVGDTYGGDFIGRNLILVQDIHDGVLDALPDVFKVVFYLSGEGIVLGVFLIGFADEIPSFIVYQGSSTSSGSLVNGQNITHKILFEFYGGIGWF